MSQAVNTSVRQHRVSMLGVKAGMTQIFTPQGSALAVTVISVPKNVITQIKTTDKDGFEAIQVGIGEKKEKNATKAELGHAKKANVPAPRVVREFRLANEQSLADFSLGGALSIDLFKEGDSVDLTSYSKGKGFQGVMKKYHFAGGPASHGASVCHRQIGSIGNRADPGKVFKGKKMPGQMGNKTVTVQNVRVVAVDLENGLILVNGSVPGPKSAVVTIRKTVKV